MLSEWGHGVFKYHYQSLVSLEIHGNRKTKNSFEPLTSEPGVIETRD